MTMTLDRNRLVIHNGKWREIYNYRRCSLFRVRCFCFADPITISLN